MALSLLYAPQKEECTVRYGRLSRLEECTVRQPRVRSFESIGI
jgi:hypothetical protein